MLDIDTAKQAAKRIMARIKSELKIHLQKHVPLSSKEDVLSAFNFDFTSADPFRSFDFVHDYVGHNFHTLMNTYGLIFGKANAGIFYAELGDLVMKLVEEHLEYLEEVEKRDGQQVLMAELEKTA